MGRKKLVDYFKVTENGRKRDILESPQQRFQQYLERRVVMIHNYIKVRWGVKPKGYLDLLDLSSFDVSWGKHYVLNIVISHSLIRYVEIQRGIIKYAMSVFPIPDLVDIKVYSGTQFNKEADVIVVQAKTALLAIVD
jgi:hypothetical protein